MAEVQEINIIGDTESPLEVMGIAIFVNKNPELVFRKRIGMRESVLLDFRGGDDSIYSGVDIQFDVKL
ncbi:MAG: hypothetical protein WC119_00415 [Synergistaceae bacterium]